MAILLNLVKSVIAISFLFCISAPNLKRSTIQDFPAKILVYHKQVWHSSHNVYELFKIIIYIHVYYKIAFIVYTIINNKNVKIFYPHTNIVQITALYVNYIHCSGSVRFTCLTILQNVNRLAAIIREIQ